jgi:hypothetical protein
MMHTMEYVTLTGGTGNGQERLITDYEGATRIATVDTAWTTTPDNTSTYSLRVTPNIVGQYINAHHKVSQNCQYVVTVNVVFHSLTQQQLHQVNGTRNRL